MISLGMGSFSLSRADCELREGKVGGKLASGKGNKTPDACVTTRAFGSPLASLHDTGCCKLPVDLR